MYLTRVYNTVDKLVMYWFRLGSRETQVKQDQRLIEEHEKLPKFLELFALGRTVRDLESVSSKNS